MSKHVTIRFQDPNVWQDERANVDNTLEKFTGTSEYPSTKSLPPIIFGLQLPEEGIDELRHYGGVIVDEIDEED